jgi:hypothetical protein
MQSVVVDARIIRHETRERARHGIGVESRLRPQSFTRTWPAIYKNSFSTLQADIQQTGASDEEMARDIQRCLGSFQLRVTAPVRRECQVASDEEAKTMAAIKITRDIRRMSSMTATSTVTRCSGVGKPLRAGIASKVITPYICSCIRTVTRLRIVTVTERVLPAISIDCYLSLVL